MIRCFGLALSFALSMMLYAALSHAAPRVVLVSRPAELPSEDYRVVAWQQLRAELESDGFELITPPNPASRIPDSLEESARRTQSFAAIRLAYAEAGVAADIWIENRTTGQTLLHRVKAQGRNAESARTLALRVTELLRASLLVLSVSSNEAAQPARSFGLSLGAALVGHPGGLSTGAAPALAPSFRVTGAVILELRLVMPVLGEETAASGRAQTDQELGLISLRLEPVTSGGLFAFTSLAAGAYRLGTRGRAVAPFVARSDQQIVLAGALGAGLGLRVVRNARFDLSFVFRGDAIALTPRPVLRFAQEEVHKAGQPMLTLAGGLEAAW